MRDSIMWSDCWNSSLSLRVLFLNVGREISKHDFFLFPFQCFYFNNDCHMRYGHTAILTSIRIYLCVFYVLTQCRCFWTKRNDSNTHILNNRPLFVIWFYYHCYVFSTKSAFVSCSREYKFLFISIFLMWIVLIECSRTFETPFCNKKKFAVVCKSFSSK